MRRAAAVGSLALLSALGATAAAAPAKPAPPALPPSIQAQLTDRAESPRTKKVPLPSSVSRRIVRDRETQRPIRIAPGPTPRRGEQSWTSSLSWLYFSYYLPGYGYYWITVDQNNTVYYWFPSYYDAVYVNYYGQIYYLGRGRQIYGYL